MENNDGVRGSLLPLLRLPVCPRGKCESVFSGVESVETKQQTPSRLEKYVRSGAHLNQNRGRCSVLLLICPPLSLLCVSFSLRLPIFISHSFFSFCGLLPLLTLFPLCALSAPHRYLITVILFLKNARTSFFLLSSFLSFYPTCSFFLFSFFHQKNGKNILNMLRFVCS